MAKRPQVNLRRHKTLQ